MGGTRTHFTVSSTAGTCYSLRLQKHHLSIAQAKLVLTLRTSSEDRLRALRTLLEERLVKRNVSLKGLDWGKVEQATS